MLRHPPQIDHVLPLCWGGEHSMSNLQALCVQCHALKTTAEQRASSLSAAVRATAAAFDERAIEQARVQVNETLGFLEPHAPELAAANRAAAPAWIAAYCDQWAVLRRKTARGSIVVCETCGATISTYFPHTACCTLKK